MIAGPRCGRRSAGPLRQAGLFLAAAATPPAIIAPGPPDLRTKGMCAAAPAAVRSSGGRRRFFATARAAAPLRCARPLRAAAPAARCRGPGPAFTPAGLFGPCRGRPPAVPPGFLARPLVRACALRGRSLAPSALAACPCFAAASLVGRPCCGAGAPCRSAWPRRVPPWPSAARLRGRAAPARGPLAALRPPLPRCGPRACDCSRAAPAALWRSGGCAVLVAGFSPCALPSRRPPLGGSGKREARLGGLRAPGRLRRRLPRGVLSWRGRPALTHCSGCGQGSSRAVPVLALAAALFLAQGLDKSEHLRYTEKARPA